MLIFWGCGNKPNAPDVSNLVKPITIERLDIELFAYKGFNYDSLHQALAAKYPKFYNDYIENVLQMGSVNNPMIDISLLRFTENENWRKVQQDIEVKFNNLKSFEKDLSLAMAYYKYYFHFSVQILNYES
jgi:hypothetical protein